MAFIVSFGSRQMERVKPDIASPCGLQVPFIENGESLILKSGEPAVEIPLCGHPPANNSSAMALSWWCRLYSARQGIIVSPELPDPAGTAMETFLACISPDPNWPKSDIASPCELQEPLFERGRQTSGFPPYGGSLGLVAQLFNAGMIHEGEE
jgi:hypothetical protein